MKTIHPEHLVDPGWETDRRPKIVKYLRSGVRVLSEMGYSYCRFDGGPPDREMGSGTLSDGVFVWPEGLAVYVERYHVRLPDEFIKHMAEKNFSLSTDLDPAAIKSVYNQQPKDMTFWLDWCKKQKRVNLLSRIGILRKM